MGTNTEGEEPGANILGYVVACPLKIQRFDALDLQLYNAFSI